jgi:hypothetical protein
MTESNERSALGDVLDHTFRMLNGRPDVVHTKASTVRSVHPVLEVTQTFIVQTFRRKEDGDWIFVEFIGKDGSVRMVLPPNVADVIGRQAVALTAKNRREAARQQAAARKAAGIKPGFLKAKKKGGPRK